MEKKSLAMHVVSFKKISRSRLPLKNISSIFPRKINRTGQTIPYEMMNRITIYNPGYVSK